MLLVNVFTNNGSAFLSSACTLTGWKLITNNRSPTSVSTLLTNKSTVVIEKSFSSSSVSQLGQTASTQICWSFLPLSDVMPVPIKRGGGKEGILSSSLTSRLFLAQFRISLLQTTHSETLILFRRRLAWRLLHLIGKVWTYTVLFF